MITGGKQRHGVATVSILNPSGKADCMRVSIPMPGKFPEITSQRVRSSGEGFIFEVKTSSWNFRPLLNHHAQK